MSQQKIVEKIVSEFQADPRNKIIISVKDLAEFSSEEVDDIVTPLILVMAIQAYQNGEADENHERLVDAATALCYQVANRCWGKCIDEDNNKWEEVDIDTDWCDADTENPEDLFVIIRPY